MFAVCFRLQIWQPWGDRNYSLFWEQHVVIPATEGLFTLSIDDPPSLAHDSRMGWTLEMDFNPISYDFQQGYKLYFLSVDDSNHPVVGNGYTFQVLPYPALCSVAVTLVTCKWT